MFAWLRKLTPPADEFEIQAREDQKKSDYPGCKAGLMQCRAFCECTMTSTPSSAWIARRAADLRRMAGCEHESTRPWSPSMFPGIVTGVQCLHCRAVKDRPEGKWEIQN